MSTSISTSFVKQYERDVHEAFQRMGSKLVNAVRWKKNVRGSSTTFQKIGVGVATTKARHGNVTPMNQSHTAIPCTISDFYAADDVDKLDEAKINHDERMAIARGGAFALGRKTDDQITTVMDSTTETTVTWTLTSADTVRNALIGMVEALDSNDAPDDGERYCAITPKAWAHALTVDQFSSADFVGPTGLPFTQGAPMGIGKWKDYLGVKWTAHSGLPGKGTATAKCFAWHKSAIGYGSAAVARNNIEGKPVEADIWWNGDRQAHRITHYMSGGSCLIDTTGVIEGNLDDTAALGTS